MLQIKNISKEYHTGDLVQKALNNVSLNLRDNEFVSILGPSGSGKTTLLNIIGGLDRYDSGDLIINNVSTKKYKDRDWDSYRNHTIGFVFQSYNLIPHQSVLANVELALTISGISKKERKRRALEALDEVGLKEQAHKKPNQMSGGQMQRVAIARALVNNPDILLADEPTGALDTQTSIQVMELLKKVANDRLVVMVTHNPELAEEYSTRIVKLKDGQIIDDSDPLILDENSLEEAKHKNLGHSSMSILTALYLSFNNLSTKLGRTLLTAFAGSIGIIGIALILSLSTGFQNYIDKIQEDTLSSYPLTITAETADPSTMLISMITDDTKDIENTNIVKEKQLIAQMFAGIGTNDLPSFMKYMDEHEDELSSYLKTTQYAYSVSPLIYKADTKARVNPSDMLSGIRGSSSSIIAGQTGIFKEMIEDDSMKDQYRVLAGHWPSAYNELLLVLNQPNSINDMLIYSLGLRDSSELTEMIQKIMKGEKVTTENKPLEFTYDDLLAISYKLVDPSDIYKYNSEYDIYENMSKDEKYMNEVIDNSVDLKIVGIVCPEENSNSLALTPGIAYTRELTKYIIEKAEKSEIVTKQRTNSEIDVFSGKRFDEDNQETGLNFEDMISIDTDMLSNAFGVEINEDDISNMTQGYMGEISGAITTDTSKANEAFTSTLENITKNYLNEYIEANKTPFGFAPIALKDVEASVKDYLAKDESQQAISSLTESFVIPEQTFAEIYQQAIQSMLEAYIGMTSQDPENPSSMLVKEAVDPMVSQFIESDIVKGMADNLASAMTEALMQKTILTKVGELTANLMGSMANAFNVDTEAIAGAFKFNLDEQELMRLMNTLSSTEKKTADNNLLKLGYQSLGEPTSISFYFKDFESKEKFLDFLNGYNDLVKETNEEAIINYTDITGILMSSVKTIVDSVSYVLIAFVSISLVVSSIMIGIITYISVLERTKEIGILRAIGASKKNISSIFNAETFMIGLSAGVLGILITLSLIPIINKVIHNVTNNYNINAVLPLVAAVTLIILSVILTLIGGIIPSKAAAKKDPVTALRSE